MLIDSIQTLDNGCILEHKSSNGSQIATLSIEQECDKYDPLLCSNIHEKFGKYLKMCKMNKYGNIIISVLDDGNIIKWNKNKDDIQMIPSVPLHIHSSNPNQHKVNEYSSIEVSDCGDSILVCLRNKNTDNMDNIWIYSCEVEKWFNTQYELDIDDGYKSYKYDEENKCWYIVNISSDTQMTYEVHLTLRELSVTLDDSISESSDHSNEDIARTKT